MPHVLSHAKSGGQRRKVKRKIFSGTSAYLIENTQFSRLHSRRKSFKTMEFLLFSVQVSHTKRKVFKDSCLSWRPGFPVKKTPLFSVSNGGNSSTLFQFDLWLWNEWVARFLRLRGLTEVLAGSASNELGYPDREE